MRFGVGMANRHWSGGPIDAGIGVVRVLELRKIFVASAFLNLGGA